MKTIIHVNRQVIQQNTKYGTSKPAITVKNYKSNTYAHEVNILGPSKICHSPNKPLPCGAKVWIETYAPVQCLVDLNLVAEGEPHEIS